MVTIRKKKLKLILRSKKKVFRRQDSPKCFDLTTVCYVFKPEYILKIKNNLFKGNSGYIEIPKIRAIDIDDREDYEIAKFLSYKAK